LLVACWLVSCLPICFVVVIVVVPHWLVGFVARFTFVFVLCCFLFQVCKWKI
jgi:hypothetical protein